MQPSSFAPHSIRMDFIALTANSVSRRFMRLSVLCALVGMGLGLYMGASEDWTLRPVHVHVNLLGWVSCALYALVYRTVPRMSEDRIARWHMTVAAVAVLGTALFFPIMLYGYDSLFPLVFLSFIAHIIGMVLFSILIFKHF